MELALALWDTEKYFNNTNYDVLASEFKKGKRIINCQGIVFSFIRVGNWERCEVREVGSNNFISRIYFEVKNDK